jgi:hypothetical protein
MHSSHRHHRGRQLAGALFALSFAGAAAAPAAAGEGDRPGTDDEIAHVRAALEAEGYTDVHDLEVDDGRFEVDAKNPAGEPVDLELDMGTLEILEEERD